MIIPIDCASRLKFVADQADFCRLAAPELPACLARILESTRSSAAQHPGETAGQLLAALEDFDRSTQGGQQPSPAAARVLWTTLEASQSFISASPDSEKPASLSMDWHSLKNDLAPLYHVSAEVWRQNLGSALTEARDIEPLENLATDVQRCLVALNDELTYETIELVAQTLATHKRAIAKAVAPARPLLASTGSFASLRAVLIVEDQWWGEVLEYKVRSAFNSKVPVRRARTLQQAVAALELWGGTTKTSEQKPVESEAEFESEFDLEAELKLETEAKIERDYDAESAVEFETGLESETGTKRASKGPREAPSGDILVLLDLGLPADEAALEKRETSRLHGKEFLMRLRDYKINARTIILTSPAEYLPDHLWISQQGIAPDDFILKTDADWDKEVDDALARALQRSRTVRRVEWDEENKRVWLDGIETSFAPLDSKILAVLSGELKEKPEPQRRRSAYTCQDISLRLDEDYGESCDAEIIPAHIHTIRRAIHARFNEVGRPVNSHQVVATIENNGESRYQLRATQFLKKGVVVTPVVPSVSIMVVEDNAAWCEAIATPLREVGYEVITAKDVADAIEKAEHFSPTVLCVDMQIPMATSESGEAIAEGGLRVIETVRANDPEVRAVVLTDLAAQDHLRIEATRRGVWIHDYIAKSDASWKWKLHRSIWRLTREWQQGIDWSAEAAHEGYVIELSRSQPRELWVDGILMSLSKTGASFIQALAARVDERLSFEELIEQVYPSKDENKGKDKTNSVIQVAKRIRNQIEDEAHEAGREVNAKHILVEESGGYLLCGPVLYRD